MDDIVATLLLSQTKGIGARKFKLLLEHFHDAATTLQASVTDLCQVEGISENLAKRIHAAHDAASMTRIETMLARAATLQVQLIPFNSSAYPQALAQIYDPPPMLYVKGNLPEHCMGSWKNLRSVSIVGTRDASAYGLEFTRQLAKDFAQSGICVVSGLALGIDSAAHWGTVNNEGTTVAVFGAGVNVIYPRQNAQLAERISHGAGALLSEYPLDTQPSRQSFPARNRIINGLSKAVIVVEGGLKSGALITADYASNEGRQVFAVPGRAGDSKAAGALALIKQGAGLIQSADDVLSEMGWDKAPAAAGITLAELDTLSQKVMQALQEHEQPMLDTLLEATGESAAGLLPALTMLELRNLIKKLPNGRYQNLVYLEPNG